MPTLSFAKIVEWSWSKRTHCLVLMWATTWQNQQNGTCAQRRFRSAWASAQSDQSSLCAQWIAKYQSFLHADSEESDLSLRWAHMPFCWFCHEAAHVYSWNHYASKHYAQRTFDTDVTDGYATDWLIGCLNNLNLFALSKIFVSTSRKYSIRRGSSTVSFWPVLQSMRFQILT